MPRCRDVRPRTVLFTALLVALGACADLGPTATDPLESVEAQFGRADKGGKKGGGPTLDEFDSLDPTRWQAGDHPLGRGWFRPDNVVAANGALELRLPAETYDGGEIRSNDRPRGGVFEARIQAAPVPGSLTAFFLYEYTESNIDEIDVEILGDGSGRVFFTTWQRSRQTNHSEVQLPFDPTADFHDYRIEVSRKRVAFYVDGELMETFRRDLPWAAMYVMANAWYPTWLSGTPPATTQAARIDWIRY